MEQDKVDVLKTLLEQSWLHIRHVENHRLWFTNMYFLVVAGTLAYLATQAPRFVGLVYPALMIFLLLLAFLGLIVCFKADIVDRAYREAIENIVEDTPGIEKNDLEKYLGYLRIEGPKGIWRKVKSIRFAYEALYFASIFMWSYLLTGSIWGAVLVIGFTILAFYWRPIISTICARAEK